MPSVDDTLWHLQPPISQNQANQKQIVMIMCGISGAGKSTMSKAITQAYPTFQRISIDAVIYKKHGLYAIDYSTESYKDYQDAASRECDQRLLQLLQDKQSDILLDLSFWNKRDRDDVKQLVEEYGAEWLLIYLRANKDVLWRRIQKRSTGPRTADSAFEVTEEVLDDYIKGFETPKGEGELIFDVS